MIGFLIEHARLCKNECKKRRHSIGIAHNRLSCLLPCFVYLYFVVLLEAFHAILYWAPRVCARVNDLNRPHAAHNTHAINGVRRRPRRHRYTEVLADKITRKRQRQRGFDCTSSFGRTQMHTLSGCVCICWRIFQGNPSCVRVCVFIADVFATTADAAQIA